MEMLTRCRYSYYRQSIALDIYILAIKVIKVVIIPPVLVGLKQLKKTILQDFLDSLFFNRKYNNVNKQPIMAFVFRFTKPATWF